MDDCPRLIISAFGIMGRIAKKVIEDLRKEGLKVGFFRPITLWPFPEEGLRILDSTAKGILVLEMNMGQMVEDIKLVVGGRIPVSFSGWSGGEPPSPQDIGETIKNAYEKLRERT